MKQLYTLFVLLIGTTSYGQVTTVLTGVDAPWGLLVDGNMMYIAERDGDKVSVLDMTDIPSGVTDVVTGLDGATDLAIYGDTLFVGERFDNDLWMVDLGTSTPTVASIMPNYITGLELVGTDMYVARNLGDSIYTVDITSPFPTTNAAFIGDFDAAYGMAIYGDDLYIADSDAGMVKKVDLSSGSPVIEDVQSIANPNEVIVYNDYLYISDFSTTAGAIWSINLITMDVQLVELGLDGPLGLAVYNDELYMSLFSVDQIAKLSLGVSIKENVDATFSVYPNPCHDQLTVEGIKEATDYGIFDLSGKIVQQGTVEVAGQISTAKLAAGTYTLRLVRGSSIQFVKE